MFKREEFIKSIFSLDSPTDFNEKALELFRFQAENVEPYKRFIDYLDFNTDSIGTIEEIPFLPISFFKSEEILSSGLRSNGVFRSSGTTGSIQSEHHVHDFSLYEKSFTNYFKEKYGQTEDLVILALLPSYLERNDSSLVYMADNLIKSSKNPSSGFYLDNLDELVRKIEYLKNSDKKTILLGVTFALSELADNFPTSDWSHVTIIETGGMKGRGKELTRTELHKTLKSALHVNSVHSEYGMTELFSQAYSEGEWFTCPKWMQILIRETEDPFSYTQENRTGGINVIDLANVDSCAFIATQDLGKLNSKGEFQVLGRFDNSEVRGCNLMVSEI